MKDFLNKRNEIESDLLEWLINEEEYFDALEYLEQLNLENMLQANPY